jgi:hypothetical protein
MDIRFATRKRHCSQPLDTEEGRNRADVQLPLGYSVMSCYFAAGMVGLRSLLAVDETSNGEGFKQHG